MEIDILALKKQPGLRLAPSPASRGVTWIQHFGEPGLPDDALRDYIRESYAIVSRNLPRKKRAELG